jgi:hypothetical protein
MSTCTTMNPSPTHIPTEEDVEAKERKRERMRSRFCLCCAAAATRLAYLNVSTSERAAFRTIPYRTHRWR